MNLEPTRLTLEERGEDGASLINTYGAAAPPQPRGLARPARSFKRLEGSAAAAGMSEAKRSAATGDRGSSRRAVAGTPMRSPDESGARHVPTRAKNEPGRADAVTGQTSDRR